MAKPRDLEKLRSINKVRHPFIYWIYEIIFKFTILLMILGFLGFLFFSTCNIFSIELSLSPDALLEFKLVIVLCALLALTIPVFRELIGFYLDGSLLRRFYFDKNGELREREKNISHNELIKEFWRNNYPITYSSMFNILMFFYSGGFALVLISNDGIIKPASNKVEAIFVLVVTLVNFLLFRYVIKSMVVKRYFLSRDSDDE